MSDQKESTTQLLSSACEAFEQARYGSAISILSFLTENELVNSQSEDSEIHNYADKFHATVKEAMDEGRYEDAMSLLEYLAKNNYNRPFAYQRIACIHFSRGEVSRGLQASRSYAASIGGSKEKYELDGLRSLEIALMGFRDIVKERDARNFSFVAKYEIAAAAFEVHSSIKDIVRVAASEGIEISEKNMRRDVILIMDNRSLYHYINPKFMSEVLLDTKQRLNPESKCDAEVNQYDSRMKTQVGDLVVSIHGKINKAVRYMHPGLISQSRFNAVNNDCEFDADSAEEKIDYMLDVMMQDVYQLFNEKTARKMELAISKALDYS